MSISVSIKDPLRPNENIDVETAEPVIGYCGFLVVGGGLVAPAAGAGLAAGFAAGVAEGDGSVIAAVLMVSSFGKLLSR